jgi:Holliday junction DNA helicase RuvA
MFYYLKGKLAYREHGLCVIDCGGVGYKLTVSMNTSDALITKLGKEVKLFTHLAVRENEVELFGFGSNEERECFNHLTSVSGIGPKAAMSILSSMTPDKLALAVCTEDTKAIAKAQGIGAKTAARIVLELKDKFSKEVVATAEAAKLDIPSATIKNSNLSEAAEGLMVLGYDRNTVLSALRGVDTSLPVGEIIRLALKNLAR